MTDYTWPPETRAAMTAEARHVALRDALAQWFCDEAQDAVKLPRLTLGDSGFRRDYLTRAGELMDVIGPHLAAAYVAGEESVRDEWRAQGGVGMEREMRAG